MTRALGLSGLALVVAGLVLFAAVVARPDAPGPPERQPAGGTAAEETPPATIRPDPKLPEPDEPVRLEVGDDLQAAVDAHPDGTHFVLASGVHRLQSIVPRDGNRFTGEPGAVLSGARVLAHFERDGDLWVATGQTQAGRVHGMMEPGYERDAHPEDLFLDGQRLRHVGDEREVGPGRWHFDYAADRILLGDDPTGRLVETSVTTFAFHGGGAPIRDVVIENLAVRHYANWAQRGAINGRDTVDWTVRYVEASHNHAVGLAIGPGMHVHNSRFAHNGQLGIGGVGSIEGYAGQVVVEDSEIAHNKELGFRWAWEGGGTKFVRTVGMVFENNWVHHNDGPGAWWDIDNVDAVVASNLVEHNTFMGIFYEISYGARIHGNVVRHNGGSAVAAQGAGVHVSNSSRVEVFGNLLYGNLHEVVGRHTDRGDGWHGRYELIDLHVHGNDIAIAAGELGLRVQVDEDVVLRPETNRFDANTYRLPDDGRWFHWGRSMTASEWRAIGHDAASTFLDLDGSGVTVLDDAAPAPLPAGETLFEPSTYGPVDDLALLPGWPES